MAGLGQELWLRRPSDGPGPGNQIDQLRRFRGRHPGAGPDPVYVVWDAYCRRHFSGSALHVLAVHARPAGRDQHRIHGRLPIAGQPGRLRRCAEGAAARGEVSGQSLVREPGSDSDRAGEQGNRARAVRCPAALQELPVSCVICATLRARLPSRARSALERLERERLEAQAAWVRKKQAAEWQRTIQKAARAGEPRPIAGQGSP